MGKAEDTKEEKKDLSHNNPEGTEVLLKKEDRDEFYLMPTAKGKKGKAKNKGGKAESAKPIKHNAETFRLFAQLKLDAPITTDDIPAILEKLEAQLESYNAKVKKWEETKAEKIRKLLDGEEDNDQDEAPKDAQDDSKEDDK